MLRASIESEGGDANLSALIDDAAAQTSKIPGAAALVAFAEATLAAAEMSSCDAPPALREARESVRAELGNEALVDAAAVIGNFERMVRIADGIGISLDTPINAATETIRRELGIDTFETAGRTVPVTGVQRWLTRAVDPMLKVGLRWRARRSGGATKQR